MSAHRKALLVAIALTVGVAACGSEQADPPTTQAESSESADATTGVPGGGTIDTTVDTAVVEAPTACVDAQPLEPGVTDGKPETVELPDVPPTDAVETSVLRAGDGPKVTDSSYVTVHYVGIACSTGEAFDSSWDRGEPITAALGTATPTDTAFQVIEGWTLGLGGQSEGSLVQLDIPPALGYGEMGSPPVINGNEPLTFVIELLTVSDTAP